MNCVSNRLRRSQMRPFFSHRKIRASLESNSYWMTLCSALPKGQSRGLPALGRAGVAQARNASTWLLGNLVLAQLRHGRTDWFHQLPGGTGRSGTHLHAERRAAQPARPAAFHAMPLRRHPDVVCLSELCSASRGDLSAPGRLLLPKVCAGGRSWLRQQKVEAKLGPNHSRPKGMHRATRERLLEVIWQCEELRDDEIALFMLRKGFVL